MIGIPRTNSYNSYNNGGEVKERESKKNKEEEDKFMDKEEEEDLNFVVQPSSTLQCPICQSLFNKAVITRECGHSFCESCITRIDAGVCPLCRTKINLSDVHQNLTVNQLVKELLVYCKYQSFGCASQVPLMNKHDHELTCQFKPIPCPNSFAGCAFKGTKQELKSHLHPIIEHPPCVYELMKDYISKTNHTIGFLREQIEVHTNEINELKRKLAGEGNGGLSSPQGLSPRTEVSTVIQPQSPRLQQTQVNARELWGVNSLKPVYTLGGHTRGVTSLALSWKRSLLFSGSHDTKIFVWDISALLTGEINGIHTDPKLLGVLESHAYTVWALVFSDDSQRLYSGSSDGSIICWDISTTPGKFMHALKGHSGKIYTMEISGDTLFSAGADRNIFIWDLTKLSCVSQLALHTDCIWSLSICENKLFSGSDDTTIRITNLESLETIKIINQESKILALAVNAQYLVAGTNDCKIKVWSTNSYQLLKTITEHSWEVWQLQLSGTLLFSGSFDHTIKIFDLTSFSCIKTLLSHKGYIHSLILGNPNAILFSGSGDKTIKVWKSVPFDTV